MLRLKNFIASFSILSFTYVFYTNQSYYKNYFSVTHTIDFLQWHISFTTFDLFRWGFIAYVVTLFFLYIFERNPKTSKSVSCFRALQKMLSNPIQTFFQGLEKDEKVGFLAVMVKMFFAPLMISWLASHVSSMLSNISFMMLHLDSFHDFVTLFQERLYWALFQMILFLDVFFFTVGYLIEHPFLKNEIKSVDPTVSGWAVALLCYPPFNVGLNNILPWQSADIAHFDNSYLFITLNFLLLGFFAVYTWASIALNLKASNLTHRGIIASGPYAFIRHPAYICKNAAWWIGAIPAFLASFQKGFFDVFLVVFVMASWSGIYFLRALTEERHLRMVNEEYDEYMKKVPYRFVPQIV